ncbi:MAG: presenilin family intramembrane aspartyl protease [Candidatus Nanoarchaeia archaeon]|nr:presenilin family intramembrane aspartyl protease [Candidatus Nanoarchaeia archaeon]MDD5587486.1 presenilin family intramembrane aspartyl protease [Candidatus Nanoarchaeia archaeon]
MKYNVKITSLMILLFIVTQLIGLYVVNYYVVPHAGVVQDLPYNIEKPQFEEQTSFIPLTIAILIASALALLLIKFRANNLWKTWFFIGISFSLLITFSVFINKLNLPSYIALIFAVVLAGLKVFKPNVYLHNLGEIFMYGGLASIFVPVLNLFSISVLLIIISIYDMIAVWKTKHMVKLAKYQSKIQIFAGLLIPTGKGKSAILGGGDIGFTLLFAGTILKISTYLNALITVLFISIALGILLLFAEKKKFYPAMPFLSAGCFIGYFVSLLI